jgi:hypothetical protein
MKQVSRWANVNAGARLDLLRPSHGLQIKVDQDGTRHANLVETH